MPSPARSTLHPALRPAPRRARVFLGALAALASLALLAPPARAATTVQIGTSGKTFASATPQCALHPGTGQLQPMVQAGLFNPKRRAEARLWLDGTAVQELDSETPSADLWLATGSHSVVVALSRRQADRYSFNVPAGLCTPPGTAGNFFSPDGTLEYAASGKSYLTVAPGCALNPASGMAQPFVHLFDNGGFLLNVSVNGVPLTQLSALRPRAVVFLAAGRNLITAANAGISTDTFVRDGGTGLCTL